MRNRYVVGVTEATPKRMSREARRTALLDAAARVLLSSDRAPLTFESIADHAGVSPTLPYKYFDSVDDVAGELYDRVVGAVDSATDRLLADPTQGFDDKVRGSLMMWCDAIRRDGPLLLRLTEGGADASLARRIDRRRERAVTVWAEVVRSEFDLDGDAARIVAASTTAGSSAVLQRWTRDRIDLDRVVELFVVLTRAQAMAAVGR